MDLNEARVEGRMLNFIQKFLKPRSFKVKVNEILSDKKIQTEDILQGNVVSYAFFVLKINKNVAQLLIDKKFKIPLYMDDLQISFHHSDLRIVERRLQDIIDIVEKFAKKNGFKLSTSKVSMLYFTKVSSPPPIELRLGNNRIQKSETVKYLGL